MFPESDELPDLTDLAVRAPKAKKARKASGDSSVAALVDDELSKLGWSDNARLSFLGDLGRENGWNRQTIFGGHADPKNKAYNRGIISWQGDRRRNLDDYLSKQGLLGRNDDEELRGMVRFADYEMKNSKEWQGIHKAVRDPNISTYDASENLRKYIKYVPDGKYNSYDPDFRVNNNKQWAERARSLGLGALPDLSDLAQQENDDPPDLSDLAVQNTAASEIGREILPQPLASLPEAEEFADVQNLNKAQAGKTDYSANPPINNSLAKQLQNLQTPAPTDADYQEYLNFTKKPDTPENKAGFLKLANSGNFGLSVETQINEPQILPNTQTRPANSAQELRAVPVAGQLLPQTSAIETNDVRDGAAGKVAVDITKKPKGENLGRYLLKTALQSVAPQYGITEEEIEKQIEFSKSEYGRYSASSDFITDDQIPLAAEELKAARGNTNIDFTVTNKTINDILNRRANASGINPELQTNIEMQSALSPGGLNQAQSNAEYFRQNTELAKTRRALEAERMRDPFSQNSVTDEEAAARLKRDQENQETAAASFDEWREKYGELAAKGFAGYLGSTARVYRALAGVTRPLSALGFSGPTETLGDVAAASEAVDKEAFKNAGILGQIYQTAVGLPTDLARLGLLSRLPGGAVVGFAADSGLQAAGRGENLADITKQTAKGAALGLTFGAGAKVGEAVKSVAPAFSTVARIGTVGTGTVGVELVSGTPLDEALKSGIVNSVFDILQASGPVVLGKVGRVWRQGKATDIAVDESGNVSLVKFTGTENPNRVDFELVLDPTDNVYKDAAEIGARSTRNAQRESINDTENSQPVNNDAFQAESNRRGNVIENINSAPRELAAENPRRIETARPEAVQKAQTDTRVQKVIENLKGKGNVTVEELQKATRFNKVNVEDAVMTLYAAKQVEILPDNSIRFISAENTLPSPRSLFERVGEIETPKENIRLSESPLESEIRAQNLRNNFAETSQSNFKAPEIPDNSIEAIEAQAKSVYENLPPQKMQQAPQIEKPIARVSFAERPNVAEKLKVYTERGREAQIEPRVVDASDLLTSLEEGYPQRFQPRDRTRAASKAQIADIASRLNPEFLGDSPKASDGRPLVVPVEMPNGATKYAVISGNGRTEGIREAYALNNENSQKYAEFARSKGATSAQNPVYVGILNPNEIEDFSEFAKESNESATAQMSASEQAQSDADRLDAGILNLFVPADDGAIGGAANRDFVRAFLQRTTSASERNRFVDADGKLSQDGVARIKNAIFAKAFGNSEMGRNTIARISESTDSNIKNITNALLAKAGELSSFAEAAKDNRRYQELDIAPDFARAMEKYSELKDGNVSLDEYIQQGTLFGADTSPLQTRVMQVFDTYKRRTKAIRAIIDNYIKAAEAIGDPNQQGLFGDAEIPSKESIFEGAVRFYEQNDSGEAEDQFNLFDADQGRENQPGARPESDGISQIAARETERIGQDSIDAPAYSRPVTVSEHLSATGNSGEFSSDNDSILYAKSKLYVGAENTPNWRGSLSKITVHTSGNALKNHPSYEAAKKGNDRKAAREVVADLAKSEKIAEISQQFPDAIIVPIMEKEGRNFNALPYGLAQAFKEIGGHSVFTNIVSVKKVTHTTKDAAERLLARKKFEGEVEKGRQYIIVDDVATQGGTVRSLKEYIESQGGEVVAVSTLISGGTGGSILGLRKPLLAELQEKFGDAELNETLREFGIADRADELTNGEAAAINGFGTLERFRDRLAEARRGASDGRTRENAADVSELQEIDSNRPKYTYLQNESGELNTRFLERHISDRVERLAQSNKSDEELLKTATIERQGDILLINPESAEMMRRFIERVQGADGGVFLGAYLPPKFADKLLSQIYTDYRYNLKDYEAKRKLKEFYDTFNGALDSEYKDSIVIVNSERIPQGLKVAVEEERAHRADFRSRDFKLQKLEVFLEVDGYEEAFKNVEAIYDGASAQTIHAEIIAKSFRSDAEEALGISQEQIDAIQAKYFELQYENDVQLTTLEKEFSIIGNQQAERFLENAKKQFERNTFKDGFAGTDEIRVTSFGQGELRPRSDTRRSETLARNAADRFPGVQRGDVQQQTSITDALRRTGEIIRVGDSTLTARDYSSKISNFENNLVNERFKDEKGLANRAKEEIYFSRPQTAAPKDRLSRIVSNAGSVALDVISVPKTLKSSFDLSAPGRQGWILTLTEPKLAATAFKQQLKSFSTKEFEKFKKELFLHPYADLADEAGLFLATQADESALTEREEAFMSRLFGEEEYFTNRAAERARKLITIGTRASERTYQTYLDSIRMGTFEKLAREIHEYNLRKNQPDGIEQFRGVATFINTATGRGDLGRFNDAAPVLNAAFFSARYWKSRLDILNPFFYAKLPAGVRKIALRKMAGFVAGVGILMLLAKAGGAEIEYDNPDNPDTLKIKFGKYSYDVTGGTISHLRFLVRFIDSLDEKDAGRKAPYLVDRYTRSKYSPTLGAARNVVEGKNYIGEKTNLKKELSELPIPLMGAGFYEAAKEDGTLGVVKTMPEFFGIGTTRYKKKN